MCSWVILFGPNKKSFFYLKNINFLFQNENVLQITQPAMLNFKKMQLTFTACNLETSRNNFPEIRCWHSGLSPLVNIKKTINIAVINYGLNKHALVSTMTQHSHDSAVVCTHIFCNYTKFAPVRLHLSQLPCIYCAFFFEEENSISFTA